MSEDDHAIPSHVRNETTCSSRSLIVQSGSVVGGVHVHTGQCGHGDRVDEAASQLAQAIRTQWLREQENRRVRDPLPLSVRFAAAPRGMIDHWGNILGTPAGSDADPVPLSGTMEQIAHIYHNVPSGRMMILGKAGAGKTVLVLRLALDLLSVWTLMSRVPVILNIGSWNPITTPLQEWIEIQLIHNYTGMESTRRGHASMASTLIAADRILPILDGLDEIAAAHRAHALKMLSESNLPMVVTSRLDEYTAVVDEFNVLSRAAAIALTEVSIKDLRDYLPRTRRSWPTPTQADSTWEYVLDRMEQEPRSSASRNLAKVLSTPLMVALARDIYSEGRDRSPAVLLDPQQFNCAEALEDHLLDAFTPALYLRPSTVAARRSQSRRRWDPVMAQRWCAFLARHMNCGGTRDFLWWNLTQGTPRCVGFESLGIAGAATGKQLFAAVGESNVRPVFGLVLVVSFAVWLSFGLARGMPAGFVFGLAGGMAFGLRIGLIVGHLGVLIGLLLDRRMGPPQPAVLGLRRNLRRAARGLLYAVGVGSIGGLCVGLISGVAIGAGTGLVTGLAVGLATALATLVNQPIDTARAVDPVSALRADRLTVLVLGSTGGVLFGAAYGVGNAMSPLLVVLSMGIFAAVGMFALAVGSAWGEFCLARTWFALRGDLPWMLFSFIQDAHQRGLLRQTGVAYQFRHTRLQDRLADTAQPR